MEKLKEVLEMILKNIIETIDMVFFYSGSTIYNCYEHFSL